MSVETPSRVFGEIHRDEATAFFFDGAARGEFLLTKCDACGTVGGPQEIQCPSCASSDLGHVPASGKAVLRSWIVLHESEPGVASDDHRKIVAVGELAEGPWWWAPLLGADPDAIREDDALVIDFAPTGDGEQLPVYRLA